MYISHPQFEDRLKQFYLSEDLLRSLHLICLSQSYLRSSPTTPILRNTGPYLLWAQHQSWSQSPSEHLTTSDTHKHLTTPNIRTTPKSCSSTNLTTGFTIGLSLFMIFLIVFCVLVSLLLILALGTKRRFGAHLFCMLPSTFTCLFRRIFEKLLD